MEIIGLDLHKRESQLASTAPDGTITDRRIVTSRDWLTAIFGDRPRARILLEASTESEWVARHLESLGHEVIVADPNFAPMYPPSQPIRPAAFCSRDRRSFSPKERMRAETGRLLNADEFLRRVSVGL
jgi:transposase